MPINTCLLFFKNYISFSGFPGVQYIPLIMIRN